MTGPPAGSPPRSEICFRPATRRPKRRHGPPSSAPTAVSSCISPVSRVPTGTPRWTGTRTPSSSFGATTSRVFGPTRSTTGPASRPGSPSSCAGCARTFIGSGTGATRARKPGRPTYRRTGPRRRPNCPAGPAAGWWTSSARRSTSSCWPTIGGTRSDWCAGAHERARASVARARIPRSPAARDAVRGRALGQEDRGGHGVPESVPRVSPIEQGARRASRRPRAARHRRSGSVSSPGRKASGERRPRTSVPGKNPVAHPFLVDGTNRPDPSGVNPRVSPVTA